jgi:hypothetical protein
LRQVLLSEVYVDCVALGRVVVVVVGLLLLPSCASVRVVDTVTHGNYCTTNAPRPVAGAAEHSSEELHALATRLQVPVDDVHTARVIGAFDALAAVADPTLGLNERVRARDEVLHRIALASLDVHSTVALLDCEAERARATATSLVEAEQGRVGVITATGLAVAGATGVLSGVLGLTLADPLPAGVVGLAGGVAEGALSIAALTVSETTAFEHPTNALAELSSTAEHPSFPEVVWHALTATDVDGSSARTVLQEAWRSAGVTGVDPDADATLLAARGIYGPALLSRRASMLQQVRTAVSLTLQDLEHLTRTVLDVQLQ